MVRLINSNSYRLRKSPVFWFSLLAMFLSGIYFYFNNYLPRCEGCENEVGAVLFNYAVLGNILVTIFICKFLGTEYKDGTLKNKVIIGCSRFKIYLSNLITCIFVSILYNLAFIISVLSIGLMVKFSITLQPTDLIYSSICSILLSVSFCSFFTSIVLNISNSSSSTIISLSIMIWSLLLSSGLPGKISYATGTRKIILEFIYDFIPLSQGLQLANLRGNHFMLSIYSCILILVSTSYGLLIFSHKDIK